MTNDYSNIDFEIEKQLCITDNVKIKDYYFKGVNFFIIKKVGVEFRFIYVTNKELMEGQILRGKELNFVKIPKNDNDINLIKKFSPQNTVYFEKITQKKVDKLKDQTNVIRLNFKEMFFIRTKEGKSWNKNKVHEKKIVFDKAEWGKKYIQSLKISNVIRRFNKELFADTTTDERIRKIAICELFELYSPEDMYLNDHKIILTQGGTGKSSILGIIGEGLETTSEAGIYGYSNPTKNTWISGKVSQTTSTIIIDEINELIKGEESGSKELLKKLNTPLEQGRYSSGKASGKKIYFTNQFLFMGNISDNFNFELFLTGMFSNTETIGRRLSYILYDNKVFFQQGQKTRHNYETEFLSALKSYCSELLIYYLQIKKMKENFLTQRAKKILDEFHSKLSNIKKDIELPKTRQFLDEYKKSSKRLCLMALKLAIFDNINEITEKGQENIHKSKIMDKYYFHLKEITDEILQSINNIKIHTVNSNTEDIKNFSIEQTKNKLQKNNLSKETMYKISENLKNFSGVKLFYENMENINKIKYLKDNIKRGKTSIEKLNKKLREFGIAVYYENENLYFVIQEKNIFSEEIKNIEEIKNQD